LFSPPSVERENGQLGYGERITTAVLLLFATLLVVFAVALFAMKGQFRSDNAVGETANLLGDIRSLLVLVLAGVMLLWRAL